MKHTVRSIIITIIVAFVTFFATTVVYAGSSTDAVPSFSGSAPRYYISAGYCAGGSCFQDMQYTGGAPYIKGTWEPSGLPGDEKGWSAYMPDDPDPPFNGVIMYKSTGFNVPVNQGTGQGDWKFLGWSTGNYTTMANTCLGGGYPCEPTYQVWWDDVKAEW